MLWGCIGDTLGMHWDALRMNCGRIGDALGMLLGWDTLGMLWGCIVDALGILWGMLWGRIWDSLGMHWGRITDALGKVWKMLCEWNDLQYFGDVLVTHLVRIANELGTD